jgi:hypothetical protein
VNMRLRYAAVAAVLAGGSLAGIAAAVGPAVAAVHPAVAPAVTVSTVDRAGKRVSAQVQLENLKTGTVYDLTSGKAGRVPDGTYNVGAEIETPGNTPSETFVDRELTVSRAGSVTLDARPGRLVRFTVNDPRATTSQVFFVTGSPVTGFQYVYGGAGGAATYVVPGKLPPGWNFYAMADLSSVTASGSPVEYGLIRVIKGDIPASPAWFSDISKLTTLHAAVRRLNPGDSQLVQLTPEVSGPSNPVWPLWPGGVSYGGTAPYTVQFRLTPGYAWQQSGPYGEELLNNAPVWGAHQYYETFGAATFGPNWAAEQAVEVVGSTLGFGTPDGQWMLEDPAVAGVLDSNSAGLPSSETAALYQGGKLIASADNGGTVTIPAVTKWYREVVVARPDSGTMFTQVTLDYTFPAAAQPNDGSYSPDYVVPTIRPSGLNGDNAARPGTRTTVPISLAYYTGPPVAGVRGVQVWASGNGGKTWAAVQVSHRGGTWTVTVTNPKTAGYVSLRVRAALSNGITTEVTVTDAYAVS